jgi:hypothetical protein
MCTLFLYRYMMYMEVRKVLSHSETSTADNDHMVGSFGIVEGDSQVVELDGVTDRDDQAMQENGAGEADERDCRNGVLDSCCGALRGPY